MRKFDVADHLPPKVFPVQLSPRMKLTRDVSAATLYAPIAQFPMDVVQVEFVSIRTGESARAAKTRVLCVVLVQGPDLLITPVGQEFNAERGLQKAFKVIPRIKLGGFLHLRVRLSAPLCGDDTVALAGLLWCVGATEGT
jgi:hypothetical protein